MINQPTNQCIHGGDGLTCRTCERTRNEAARAEQLERLRQEYRQTTDPEERERITRQARLLKAMRCYQCETEPQLSQDDPDFPFCSKACHGRWAEENDHQGQSAGKRPTIRQMRERLLELAKEEHVKGATT
jgi:endogenous inhibitor of DNA gyrase (YacG/DUF329 family)